ncbi:hypothetical protein PP655_gp076 [Bacillus phage PBC4]|uniref:Uncharacterized protein n=1 Tax=Bacillus phage PBC4 TaxID=1675028 RepID=A0A1I7NZN7_9CAUD|nr:hypothetical protein PP655_gp076 [Bacillus phage PBC4]AKQ08268.1 hypothetical protein PBC4_076 [Bacillus phage PBC4]
MRSSHLNRLYKIMKFEEWEKLFDITPHENYHRNQMKRSKCPICNSNTWHESYDGDLGCVEHWDNCNGCGFFDGWSYGLWEFGFQKVDEKGHVRRSYNSRYDEIEYVIASFRKKYKRQRKLMWKKKKSQRKKGK